MKMLLLTLGETKVSLAEANSEIEFKIIRLLCDSYFDLLLHI